ncbi:MAG: helix-turn-helix domain-containing protein [Candidatus Magasanikbacteria bacterium]|nr:helix-turn-helix domain-containing protein [Candidatus Magasanikbacteria bacterium]
MPELIRISISEASRLFGINPQTIRRGIKDQEITYVVVLGRYQLNFESVLKWSQNNLRRKHKMEQKGIGQFVDHWKIGNKLFSPNPKSVKKKNTPVLPKSK